MSVQLPADTTAYKSLTLFKKSIYSHDVRFKNILYRSLAVSAVWILHDCNELVLVRNCSRIHMMEIQEMEIQEMEKGGSSLFQSWAFYAEMLLIFYLSCVA